MAEPIFNGLCVAFLASFAVVLWRIQRSPRRTQPDTTPAAVPPAPARPVGKPDSVALAEQRTDDIEAGLKAYATRIADLYDTTPGGNP